MSSRRVLDAVENGSGDSNAGSVVQIVQIVADSAGVGRGVELAVGNHTDLAFARLEEVSIVAFQADSFGGVVEAVGESSCHRSASTGREEEAGLAESADVRGGVEVAVLNWESRDRDAGSSVEDVVGIAVGAHVVGVVLEAVVSLGAAGEAEVVGQGEESVLAAQAVAIGVLVVAVFDFGGSGEASVSRQVVVLRALLADSGFVVCVGGRGAVETAVGNSRGDGNRLAELRDGVKNVESSADFASGNTTDGFRDIAVVQRLSQVDASVAEQGEGGKASSAFGGRNVSVAVLNGGGGHAFVVRSVEPVAGDTAHAFSAGREHVAVLNRSSDAREVARGQDVSSEALNAFSGSAIVPAIGDGRGGLADSGNKVESSGAESTNSGAFVDRAVQNSDESNASSSVEVVTADAAGAIGGRGIASAVGDSGSDSDAATGLGEVVVSASNAASRAHGHTVVRPNENRTAVARLDEVSVSAVLTGGGGGVDLAVGNHSCNGHAHARGEEESSGAANASGRRRVAHAVGNRHGHSQARRGGGGVVVGDALSAGGRGVVDRAVGDGAGHLQAVTARKVVSRDTGSAGGGGKENGAIGLDLSASEGGRGNRVALEHPPGSMETVKFRGFIN